MVRLTDRLDMTVAVYRGRKKIAQQQICRVKSSVYVSLLAYMLKLETENWMSF